MDSSPKNKGGRPRQVPVYREGPEAQQGFLDALRAVVKAPKHPRKKKAA